MMKQKTNLAKSAAAIILCLITALAVCGCADKEKSKSRLWDTALYTQDTTFGKGKKTLTVTVSASKKTVTFTLHTNKNTVADALLEQKLIDGEGTLVDTVNGMKADYNKDKAYWAFNKDGSYMNTGLYETEFKDGESYELVYTK